MAGLSHTAGLVVALALLPPAATAAFELDEATESAIDSLYGSDEAVDWVALAAESPSVYVGASFRTFPHAFQDVESAILDFDSYGDAFRYVRQFVPVAADSLPRDSSYRAYFELGTLLYRVWALARVASIDSMGDSALQVGISQIHDPSLNGRWRDAPKGGLIAIEVDHFNLRWYCRRLGPRQTRAGFVAWLSPTIALPRWILRFAYRAFVPRFLDDVDERLRSEE